MLKNITAAILCSALLTGCSWLGDWPPGSKSAEGSSVRIVENGDGSYHAEQGRALPPPYVKQERAEQPRRESGRSYDTAESGRPAATPLDLTPLRERERERSPSAMPVEERLAMLEENVMQIETMLSAMQPSLERFAGLEDSLQRLLHDMEGVSSIKTERSANDSGHENNDNMPENLLPASSPAAAPPVAMTGRYEDAPQTGQTAATVQKGAVRQLRIGEHPEKTRIVMDATAGLDFNIHNENQGRVLIVDLPAAGWDAAASMQAANSPLIESYQTQPDGNGGTRLFLSLKEDVRVLWAEALAPVGGKGYRIVIDLAGV